MNEPPTVPRLTPQFCLSPTTLQAFLRTSRAQIDDSITTSLNALLVPARAGFDPSYTSTRHPYNRAASLVPRDAREAFTGGVLFPGWEGRDRALEYCEGVATRIGAGEEPGFKAGSDRDVVGYGDDDRIVEASRRRDPRGDPYANRGGGDGPSERLRGVLSMERGVERIVRERTWGIVRSRCADVDEEVWEEALGSWRKNR